MKFTLITTFTMIALGIALSSCNTTTAPAQSKGGGLSATEPAKAKPYPLETCIVSGEDLESMGGAVTKVYKGQEVKFCCKSCVKDFDADPEKFLAKLP